MLTYGNCFTMPTGLIPISAVYDACYYGEINTGITTAACNISADGIISIFLDTNTTLADIIGKTVRISLMYFVG